MSEKIYAGTGKAFTFSNGGTKVSCSICLSDLPKEFITIGKKNGKKYIKLDLLERKNGEDDFGNTHYLTVDTWKPTQQREEPKEQDPWG